MSRWLASYGATVKQAVNKRRMTRTVVAENATKHAPTKGTVSLRAANVGGEIRLFRKGEDGRPDRYIWIDHGIDLSIVTADKLILSAYSFDDQEAEADEVPSRGISLANATIRELEVPAIRGPGSESPRSPFPVPIDLGDSRISVWNVSDDSLPRRKRFAALLRQDKRFRRSTYLALEAYFRNQGHDEDANAIYREMSKRAHEQAWTDLSRRLLAPLLLPLRLLATAFLYLPFRLLLGFGTRPVRLLGVIGALWLVSLPVYRNPENLEPSIAERAARASEPSGSEIRDRPSVADWGWSEALALSLRFHAPIGGLAPARPTWDLRDSGVTCWGPVERIRTAGNPDGPAPSTFTGSSEPNASRGCDGKVVSVAPEDWGLAMSVLNLVMWPLVLTFGLRKLLRQT